MLAYAAADRAVRGRHGLRRGERLGSELWSVRRRSAHLSLRAKLRFVGLSDTGKVREHNEDTIAHDPDIGLLVLADGMGGYNAGEVASGIAVKTIVNLVKEQVEREDMNVQDRDAGLSRSTIILRDAIQRAN